MTYSYKHEYQIHNTHFYKDSDINFNRFIFGHINYNIPYIIHLYIGVFAWGWGGLQPSSLPKVCFSGQELGHLNSLLLQIYCEY